jgi:hypothetical protein
MNAKPSLIFGMLVLMLAIGTFAAGAATAPVAAGESSSPTAFLCNLSLPTATAPTAGQPAPLFATPSPCGICSDFACQTRSVGAVCGTGSQTHCLDYYGTTCPQDGGVNCKCARFVP